MGVFDGLFGKKKGMTISSPADGECISLSKVNDPTFSEGILGKGVAIMPASNQIVAPADGTIDMIFPTGHAFTMTTKGKTELLVHIGIDTVQLKGEHFKKLVSDGDEVHKGDLVIEVDLEAVKKAGYDTVIPMVVCNTDAYKDVKTVAEGTVTKGQDVLEIEAQ